MTDEEWIKMAMTDDAMVVNLLLRLHQTDPQPVTKIAPPLHLDWTVRQRRSKPVLKHADSSKKNEGDKTRASPTTPLCWSGATSVSGGGGAVEGFEESSRPTNPSDDARSKVAVTSETTITTINKRSRKKKTLTELREEENWLLKERRYLKTELDTLRLTVEKHRSTNESLKRVKLDSQSCQTMKTVMTHVVTEEAISNQLRHMDSAHACPPTDLPTGVACNNLYIVQQTLPANTIQKDRCLLPDLNLPIDDADSDILYGMS